MNANSVENNMKAENKYTNNWCTLCIEQEVEANCTSSEKQEQVQAIKNKRDIVKEKL